ncbi:MAG: hypothetical protein PHH82_04020 [Candidatus ainarchaeum sp.]|nr:hypothetical protein [Candidatus ainarchaeum sp.]
MNCMKGSIYFLISVFILSSLSLSISCLALAGGYDLNAIKGQEYYFDFTVYNNDADSATVCDPGMYSMSLSVVDGDIDDLFDYKISENDLVLNDTDTKKVMVSITPLVDSGQYEILVTVKRADVGLGQGGTKIFNSTVGKIKVNLGGETKKTSYDEVPEWYAYEQQQEDLNADQNAPLANNPENNSSSDGNTLLYVLVIIMAAVILFMAFILYKRR